MRRNIGLLALSVLLAPGVGLAASREQQEMQRDIAQLQDQVRSLQSSFDTKMAALETLVQQALDAGNKANTNVSVLNSNVTQTLDRELKDALRPVAGVSSKLDNVTNDLSDVRNSMADLTTQINRLQQQLNDLNNAVKVLQAPPAAPPPSNTNPDSANARPPAAVLWQNARSDYSAGKSDLAAQEFTNFVNWYPDDPQAPEAQLTVGEIHYSQHNYDQAVMDFDAVLERFPEGKVTPDAYFLKGKALSDGGMRDAGAKEFRTLIKKYPRSNQAKAAAEQLRAMGLSTGTTTARRKK